MRQAWLAAGIAAVSIGLLGGVSGAQAPPPGQPGPAQPTPVPSPTAPTAPVPTPPATEEERPPAPTEEQVGELERVPEELLETRTPTILGPDLFNPPAHQGWINITPSFTLSAEYNDNLFLSSRDRTSDVIFGLTPGVTLSMQRGNYRLLGGYNTTGQLYVEESDLNDFGKSQDFFVDYSYRASPRVTFSLSDRFVFGQNSNVLTSSGASAGRRDAWRNTFTPRLRWQATPTTAMSLTASHTILRFSDDGGSDSDTYRFGIGIDRQLTQRLTGRLGAGVAYLDFEEDPSVWTYTPTVGFAYDVTQTLRVSVAGGPSIVEREGDITVTPAVAAALTQTFKFGTVGLGYDKAVTAETVGISDRQTIFGTVTVPTLLRGLRLGFTPRYSIVDRHLADGAERDLKVLTLALRGTYQVARNISLIGSYTFYQQTRGGTGVDEDIDQNRVFLGLQYAFPITIY